MNLTPAQLHEEQIRITGEGMKPEIHEPVHVSKPLAQVFSDMLEKQIVANSAMRFALERVINYIDHKSPDKAREIALNALK